MISSEVQRTLVKSPPELWAELSDPAALARHLGELGEIKIIRIEPRSFRNAFPSLLPQQLNALAEHYFFRKGEVARIAGLDVTIIDPRTAFATPERFPDTPVHAQWPQEALAAAPLDRYTAICLLTHDPKIDDPALVAALKADCFYIGALGSRKTHAKRIERMRAEGFDAAAIDRIHAPIGLDIGAVSPAEIAVSIIGEIVASLRKKPLRSESAAA